MKYIYGIACVVLFVSAHAQLSSELIESIGKRIEYDLNHSIVIGVIDDQGTHYYNYGKTEADGQNVDEHSIYEIGSISKTFTAVLLADQVLKGTMKLDDPISDYLPEHVNVPQYNGREITLAHLSDHTSSLPRMPDNFNPADPDNPYADYTEQDMYDFISSCSLDREIGSEFEYSNLAQGLLGHILALHTGMSYSDLLREVILEPLHMNETGITLSKSMKSNLAKGHNQGAEVKNWDLNVLAGAGGIRSSSSDMLTYLEANLKGGDTPLHKAMKLTHAKRHDKGPGIGLGWFIDDQTIAHGGATGGYRASAAFLPKDRKAYIVLTNSTRGVDDILRHLIDPTHELEPAGKPLSAELRKIIDEKGPTAALDRYQEFRSNDNTIYSIDENNINSLGYYYLPKNTDAALALFKINIEHFPKSSNPYDSYGEALYKKSIEMYKKSIELNPANANGREMLEKMGVKLEEDDSLAIDRAALESYVGVYQLAPGFNIEVFLNGEKLMTQATGQSAFQIFPTTATRWYLKVVDAQLEFNILEDGKVDMVTLFQGGQEIPGKRIE